MSNFSFSFRDKPRLSERLRGKSGDELFKELRKELDHDRKSFFDSPSSNFGTSTGSFSRAGHFFDEPLIRGQTDIRSHLEDLAKRHPEFADQLQFPAWSNNGRNKDWEHKQQNPNLSQAEESSEQQPQEQPQEPPPDTQPRTETIEESTSLRGQGKDNLRNTVPDMGQKQQEAENNDSRGQRSWSAPPDSRAQQSEKPRFISKIEITPVNPDASQTQTGNETKPPMAPPKPHPQPQPQQSQTQPKQTQPNVRHIPIFVEGRDEPVLPKNLEPELTQTQAPPQQFSRPPPQSQFTSSQHHFQPQEPTRKQQTPPRNEVPPQVASPSPRPEQTPVVQPSTQTEQQQQPEQPPVNPKDPLYRVGLVQKEVDDLKILIDNFNGNSRSDKEYIILDEFLTRNLIKLDDIETEGKEEVRAARKNTIKSIQRCISVLENKVPAASGKQETEALEVESDLAAGVNSEVVSEGNEPITAQEHKQMEQGATNSTDMHPVGEGNKNLQSLSENNA